MICSVTNDTMLSTPTIPLVLSNSLAVLQARFIVKSDLEIFFDSFLKAVLAYCETILSYN